MLSTYRGLDVIRPNSLYAILKTTRLFEDMAYFLSMTTLMPGRRPSTFCTGTALTSNVFRSN